jgi:tetratricopeptide (TPR) repeat protein
VKKAILWLSALSAVIAPIVALRLNARDARAVRAELSMGLAILRTPVEQSSELSSEALHRAQAAFDRARSAHGDPDDTRRAQALWHTTQAYVDLLGDSPAFASQEADTAVRLDPDGADEVLVRALVALRLGHVDDGELQLDRLVTRDPRRTPAPVRARAQLALLERRIDAHRMPDAETLAEALDREHPQVARIKNLLGVVREAVGDRSGAREAYRAACPLDPTMATPWVNLARLDRADGDRAAARTDIERALGIVPDDPEAWLAYGVVLGELHDPAARHALVRAAELAPDAAAPWIAQGDLDLAAADLSHAVESYREAITRDADAPSARTNLGIALARSGDRAGALVAFEEATRRAPHVGEAWNGLGAMRLAQGDAEGSLGALQQASVLLPEDPNPPMNLARAYEDLQRWTDAVHALREVLRRDPTHAVARDHLHRITAPQQAAHAQATTAASVHG